MTDETIILPTDDEAAEYRTDIEGWISRTGLFFGGNEDSARYSGSTHTKCKECGAIRKRGSYCQPCHKKKMTEKYNALPEQEWSGEYPLILYNDDTYFWDIDGILDLAHDEHCSIADLQLVFCKEAEWPEVEEEFFANCIPDDCEAPDELIAAIAEFNARMKEIRSHCWYADNIAVVFNESKQ